MVCRESLEISQMKKTKIGLFFFFSLIAKRVFLYFQSSTCTLLNTLGGLRENKVLQALLVSICWFNEPLRLKSSKFEGVDKLVDKCVFVYKVVLVELFHLFFLNILTMLKYFSFSTLLLLQQSNNNLFWFSLIQNK